MLVEALLVCGAAAITSVVGVPIAVRLARLPSFTTTRPTTQRKERQFVGTTGFEPLDLGPDRIHWPSATPWLSSNTIPIEWPSKSWDDEHFGRQWRDGTAYEVEDLGFHAMLKRRADAAKADAREATARALATSSSERAPPPPSSAEQAFFQPQPQPQPQPQRSQQAAPAQPQGWQPDADRIRQLRAQQELARRAAAKKQQEAIQAQAAKQAAARSQRAPTPKAPPPRPARPQPAGNGPPTRAELEAMVEREGLAGTVQIIMRRTGWDFRKAAQYLARTRAQ